MTMHRTPAQLRAWFDSEEFREQYHTEERLGAWVDEAGTHFVLWAPTAEEVLLNYDVDAQGVDFAPSNPMKYVGKGCWRYDHPDAS